MTLPVPNLDSRTFENLVAEALRRVPRYTPDWTNHNDSDPGKALITLNAWLTETLLYQINQVPQQNYVAFLNLLGITPQPARAAATELTFTLKPLALPTDPLTVNLPAATRVAVDDPDLPTEVVFETGAAARALNAAVALALVPGADGTWSPVTSFDSKAGVTTWLQSRSQHHRWHGEAVLRALSFSLTRWGGSSRPASNRLLPERRDSSSRSIRERRWFDPAPAGSG